MINNRCFASIGANMTPLQEVEVVEKWMKENYKALLLAWYHTNEPGKRIGQFESATESF